jgi:hypothetical protein
MNAAEDSVPAREKRKSQEKRVPPSKAWPSTLINTRSEKDRSGRRVIASMTGRFASPIRRKGRGFGIMYSMVENRKHKAPRRAIRYRSVVSTTAAA